MDTLTLITLVAVLATTILSLVAIWLCLTFFRMASEQLERARDAGRDAQLLYQRLEELRASPSNECAVQQVATQDETTPPPSWALHLDRDLAEDVGQQLAEQWQQQGEQIRQELTTIIEEQMTQDGDLRELEDQLEQLLDGALVFAREGIGNIRQDLLRQRLLQAVEAESELMLATLVDKQLAGFSLSEVFAALDLLLTQGELDYAVPDSGARALVVAEAGLAEQGLQASQLPPNALIRLVPVDD